MMYRFSGRQVFPATGSGGPGTLSRKISSRPSSAQPATTAGDDQTASTQHHAAHSEVDLFLRAVGFVLTGSGDADQYVIGDRTNCVFAIDHDVYRLNNVRTNRIMIQGWQRQQPWGLEQ